MISVFTYLNSPGYHQFLKDIFLFLFSVSKGHILVSYARCAFLKYSQQNVEVVLCDRSLPS